MNDDEVDMVQHLEFVPEGMDVGELANALHSRHQLTDKMLRIILQKMARDLDHNPCVEGMVRFRQCWRRLAQLREDVAVVACKMEVVQVICRKYGPLIRQVMDVPVEE